LGTGKLLWADDTIQTLQDDGTYAIPASGDYPVEDPKQAGRRARLMAGSARSRVPSFALYFELKLGTSAVMMWVTPVAFVEPAKFKPQ
jgi:hypothetical protein